MEVSDFSSNTFTSQIKKLLTGIQNITIQMSNTFQQGILKHQEQFIKTYKIKISQLVKLFEQLTKILEDKFVNNQLTNRLDIVMKQRDYFKYECLKLNVQYQTAKNQQNGHAGQIASVTEQMKIYKHLLEEEKVKNQELQKREEKMKNNFSQMAYKTLSQTIQNTAPKFMTQQRVLLKKTKKIQSITNELHQKNQTIRNLKLKLSQLQLSINDKQIQYIQKNQLYQTFKSCVNSWKRDILTKQRKNIELSIIQKKTVWNPQKLSLATKQDLLRYFFTNVHFLGFIEKLLFDPGFKVQFQERTPQGDLYMKENRSKLYQFMRKKKIIATFPLS